MIHSSNIGQLDAEAVPQIYPPDGILFPAPRSSLFGAQRRHLVVVTSD